MSYRDDAMRAMVRTVLTSPLSLRWTVQGFGMIRAYPAADLFGKRFRLNVWSASLAVPNVSIIHDHPWSFESRIISGRFRNVRYVEAHDGDPYLYMTIKTGEGGGAEKEAPGIAHLKALPPEDYVTGDEYEQHSSEIHASLYADGTVTLNDRVGDTEHARVFWSDGSVWVDAKPREATASEVLRTIALALDKWE